MVQKKVGVSSLPPFILRTGAFPLLPTNPNTGVKNHPDCKAISREDPCLSLQQPGFLPLCRSTCPSQHQPKRPAQPLHRCGLCREPPIPYPLIPSPIPRKGGDPSLSFPLQQPGFVPLCRSTYTQQHQAKGPAQPPDWGGLHTEPPNLYPTAPFSSNKVGGRMIPPCPSPKGPPSLPHPARHGPTALSYV